YAARVLENASQGAAMNAVAVAFSETSPRPSQERHAVEVRVIVGGRTRSQRIPRHARAERIGSPRSRLGRTLAGTPYPLSAKDRSFAVAAGIVFAVVSFA